LRCPTILELPPPTQGLRGWPWTEEGKQLDDKMPDGQRPKISIVTPSFNQGQFLEKAIRSVLLQGYSELEYIIIDGGSTDNSAEIIKKYDKWLAYWVTERDRGQSHAINKGFEKATGVIYAWLNSDDYLLIDALMNVAAAYQKSLDAGGWFGGCFQVNIHDKTLLSVYPNRLDAEHLAIWGENAVTQPACFFSSVAWGKCGPLDESLHFAMDFDLWIKIAKEFSIVKINEALAAAVVHSDAKTQINAGQMFAEQDLVRIRHGYEDLAVQDISRWISDCIELGGKYWKLTRIPRWISRFPLFRPFMPAARIIWKILT
jgi:glycosyltransferase involved in cell wall biosynthesis